MAMPRIARSAGLLSMARRPSVVYRVSASHRLRLYCSARPSVVLLDRRRRSAWRPASGEPRLWAYVVDERPWAGNRAPAAFYRYSPDRKGERPRDHLAGYQGFLHADAYSGYERLYRPQGNKAPTITRVACMAHACRYFFDVYDATKSPIAEEAGMAHPIGQHLPVDLEALPGEDLGLAIERQSVAILRHDHLRSQARPRPALADRQVRARRLKDGLTGAASKLRPHVADHLELYRDRLKDLGHVLADPGQLGLAARAGDLTRELDGLARQMLG